MAYTTRALVKASLGIPSATTSEDTAIDAAILAADAEIDQYTGRTFENVTQARVYVPTSSLTLNVDDIATLSGLQVKVDNDADGTYETTLTINTDFIVAGNKAPYRLIRQVNQGWPLTIYARPTVQVTATWGYATTVPAPVKQAALLLSARLYQRKASPLGYAAGVVSELGPVRISRNDPDVGNLLAGYRLLGVA